jgi:hypothetical protein
LENLKKELEEKQGLLNQAARAIKLFEEQKEATSRTQEQYQQTLEKEREKVIKLEKGNNEFLFYSLFAIIAEISEIILRYRFTYFIIFI